MGTYNMDWQGLFVRQNELQLTMPKAGMHSNIMIQCRIYSGIGSESSNMNSFQRSKLIDLNKYCSQLSELKTVFDEKCTDFAKNV